MKNALKLITVDLNIADLPPHTKTAHCLFNTCAFVYRHEHTHTHHLSAGACRIA